MQVWLKPLAMLNLRTNSVEAYVRWKDIGITDGPARGRDLWRCADLGVHVDAGRDFATRYRAMVPPHDVVMLRIRAGRGQ